MITTNADLIRELRKPGKVEMGVSGVHDIFMVQVEKSDLIRVLLQLPKNEASPWEFCELDFDNGGVRRLDIQWKGQ